MELLELGLARAAGEHVRHPARPARGTLSRAHDIKGKTSCPKTLPKQRCSWPLTARRSRRATSSTSTVAWPRPTPGRCGRPHKGRPKVARQLNIDTDLRRSHTCAAWELGLTIVGCLQPPTVSCSHTTLARAWGAAYAGI